MTPKELRDLSRYLGSKNDTIFLRHGKIKYTLCGINLKDHTISADEAPDATFKADDSIKPFFRPMSDWSKKITIHSDEFIPIIRIQRFIENHYETRVKISDEMNLWELPAFAFEMLIDWSFDVNGWIDSGQALSIYDGD